MATRTVRRGRGVVAALTVVAAVLAGCGTDDASEPTGSQVEGAAPVLDAALIEADDLGTDVAISPWEEGEPLTSHAEECTDLPALDGGPSRDDLVQGTSSAFSTEPVEEGLIGHAWAISSALVYPTADEAEAAFAAIDEDLVADCITPTVRESSDQDVVVEDGPSADVGDEAATYTFTSDPYTASDDTDTVELTVVRVDRAVLVFQVAWNGPYYAGAVDTRAGLDETVEGVVADVEAVV